MRNLKKEQTRDKRVTTGEPDVLFYFLEYLLFNFYCYSITLVWIFSPSIHPTPVEHNSLPCLHTPRCFCQCVLYSSSCKPLSPSSPLHSPLAIVRLFLTSVSLVIFCLLFSSIYYVPVKGEIIWYLSLAVPMFIAAQFTIAKYWKQSKCPSANEWIKKLWYIYTMEFYAAERKKELIPFATAWMELESIMLNEISQKVRYKYHMISPLTGT